MASVGPSVTNNAIRLVASSRAGPVILKKKILTCNILKYFTFIEIFSPVASPRAGPAASLLPASPAADCAEGPRRPHLAGRPLQAH